MVHLRFAFLVLLPAMRDAAWLIHHDAQPESDCNYMGTTSATSHGLACCFRDGSHR
jgi:hypothetical protein